jgi:bacteriorhodopsin
MKMEKTVKTRVTIIFGIVGLILLIPLIAMQFTKEVKWDIFDFVVMGTLLLITGLAIELVTRKLKSTYIKIGLALIILIMFLLIWAELAVGIFGSPFAGK